MKPLIKTSKALGGFLAALLLAGCMTTGGGSAPSKPAKPYATTGQAFTQFKQICLKSPFNNARNIAAFRASPVFIPEENSFKIEGVDITSFKHKTVAMSGSVNGLAGTRFCTITYTPAGNQTNEALVAAGLMNGVAGIKARPSGITGGGFVYYPYKGGNLVVMVSSNGREISLSTQKR